MPAISCHVICVGVIPLEQRRLQHLLAPATVVARDAADVLFVVAPFIDCDLYALISRLRRDAPWQPVLLATHWQPKNLAGLARFVIDEVVDLARPEAWAAAIFSAAAAGQMRRIAGQLRPELSRITREALIQLLTRRPPVRTARKLAHLLACDQSTLWRNWTKDLGRNAPPPSAYIRLVRSYYHVAVEYQSNLSQHDREMVRQYAGGEDAESIIRALSVGFPPR
jgi:hypothetical protein